MFILTLAIIAFQFGRNYNKISDTVRGIISDIRPIDRGPLKQIREVADRTRDNIIMNRFKSVDKRSLLDEN